MLLKHDNLTIRNAAPDDADLLCAWWNDGGVMAHAGFPNGLGTCPARVIENMAGDSDDTHRLLILELDGVPVGEMNYRNLGNGVAVIGIKICEADRRGKGHGTRLLRMLIGELFSRGYKKIALDTNLENVRAQHVYEKLGFKRVRVNRDSWRDQLGALQSSVDYELIPANFRYLTPRSGR
jgi:RimJ/RimL family protein N-acetyltransferase